LTKIELEKTADVIWPVSTIILTYGRDDALGTTIARLFEVAGNDPLHEIVLVDNNEDDVDRSHFVSCFGPKANYVKPGKNLGVTGGRNEGIRYAQGEILLFLDDDALLEVEDDFLERLRERFTRADMETAVVAFRSEVGENRVSDPKEFPHTDKTLPRDKPFETFRFIGVAHAVRMRAMRNHGPYCPGFFYGMEEFDLAYRFIKAGWKIEYRPEFAVRHMKHDQGRLPSKQVVERMYANKLAVGWMHLPMREFALSGLAWFVKTLLDSKDPRVPFKALWRFRRMALNGEILPRDPSSKLVATIRRLGGAAWK
jgi:GT2 family glycosyltransferase